MRYTVIFETNMGVKKISVDAYSTREALENGKRKAIEQKIGVTGLRSVEPEERLIYTRP